MLKKSLHNIPLQSSNWEYNLFHTSSLEATLKYLECIRAKLIICRETNINYSIDNHKKDQLQMLLNMFNLKQVTSQIEWNRLILHFIDRQFIFG